jgi:hypothetical protein
VYVARLELRTAAGDDRPKRKMIPGCRFVTEEKGRRYLERMDLRDI